MRSFRQHDSPSMEAAAAAVRFGVLFAFEIGFLDVVIESDSTNVVRAPHRKEGSFSPFGPILEDIFHLTRQFRSCSFNHVTREGNTAAQRLGKFALNVDNELVWVEECPSWLELAVLNDVLLYHFETN